MQLKNTSTLSWLNDRIPEMAWAALILEACGREKGLEVFRRFCIRCRTYLHEAQSPGLDWDAPDGNLNGILTGRLSTLYDFISIINTHFVSDPAPSCRANPLFVTLQ